MSKELVRLVHSSPPGHAAIRDQALRASVSVGVGVAEGAAHDGAAAKRHYRIARGSAMEVAAAYELAEAIGEAVPVTEVTELATRVVAMLTRMVR